MVEARIEDICKQVIVAHVEENAKGGAKGGGDYSNMNYIVKHQNKQAIFKLKKDDENFGKDQPGPGPKGIRSDIAQYFGLPEDSIFFKNQKKQILLRNNKVKDELFPLQTSKIKTGHPVLEVVFHKDINTLDYILGDPREREAKKQREMAREKEKQEREGRENKERASREKNEKMASMI